MKRFRGGYHIVNLPAIDETGYAQFDGYGELRNAVESGKIVFIDLNYPKIRVNPALVRLSGNNVMLSMTPTFNFNTDVDLPEIVFESYSFTKGGVERTEIRVVVPEADDTVEA